MEKSNLEKSMQHQLFKLGFRHGVSDVRVNRLRPWSEPVDLRLQGYVDGYNYGQRAEVYGDDTENCKAAWEECQQFEVFGGGG